MKDDIQIKFIIIIIHSCLCLILTLFSFVFRQAAQKRHGHSQAETGEDPETQQTQPRLCVTLQIFKTRQNETRKKRNIGVFVTRHFSAVENGERKNKNTAWRRRILLKTRSLCMLRRQGIGFEISKVHDFTTQAH